MSDELAHNFAAQSRCVIVAPAGCGKTELIVQAVASSVAGCQLILTHTHAGVRALRDRLRKYEVEHGTYVLDTIAGFALRYTASFPSLSGCQIKEPTTTDEWLGIYKGASQIIQQRHIRAVIRNTYTGLYIDEYQDCTVAQHKLIMALADLLPTRIVGDPLQGIFGFDPNDPLVMWQRDIFPFFTRLPDLATPYRWQKGNPILGQWLVEVREHLIAGNPIHLRNCNAVTWIPLNNKSTAQYEQIKACRRLLKHADDSIAIVRKWPNQSHSTSKMLQGRFRSMEDVGCKDLLEWCKKLEDATGIKRAKLILSFALNCMTKKPSPLNELCKLLAIGKLPGDNKLKNLADLKAFLLLVAEKKDFSPVASTLRIIVNLPDVTIHRKELYWEMIKVAENFDASLGISLYSTAWKIRDCTRKFGRFIDPRVVSRTTLVKGLEFDHVVIVDAGDFDDAKNLYVALTRGAKSLVVCSSKSTIQRASPYFKGV